MPVFPTPQTDPQKITPSEYNGVQTIIAEVMGQPRVTKTPNQVTIETSTGATVTTDNTFGYNQTLASSQIATPTSTNRTVITAQQLYNLRDDILRARLHQLGDTTVYRNNAADLVFPYVNTTATSVIPGASALMTATTSGSNVVTLNSDANVNASAPIVFNQTIGGLTSGTVYYVDQKLGNNQITLKLSPTATPAVSPVLTTTNLSAAPVGTTVYSQVIVGTTVGMTVGGGLTFTGTAFSSFVNNTTYYIVLIVDGTKIVVSDNAPVGNNIPTPAKSLSSGTGTMTVIGTGTYASRYVKIYADQFQKYANIATAALTERTSADLNQITPITYNLTRDGTLSPWGGYNQAKSLTQTIQIDFGTYAASLGFFNAGGYIELDADMSDPDNSAPIPNSSAKNLSWKTIFANVGKLQIRRTTVTRGNNLGSGVTLASTSGFLNLTTSPTEIVSAQPSTTYTANRYTVTAKKLGTNAAPTGIEIVVKYSDLSGFYTGAVGEYAGGPTVNLGGGMNTAGARVDESVTGLLTSILNVYRSTGSTAVSSPAPTVNTGTLVAGEYDPTFTVTSTSPETINEGASITWTITATNFGSGTIYYSIDAKTNTQSNGNGWPAPTDFSDNVAAGPITMTNNSATLTKTLKNDTLSDGLEVIYLRIRVDSTSGQVVANAPPIYVVDTSLTAPPAIPSIPTPTGTPPAATTPGPSPVLNGTLVFTGLAFLGSQPPGTPTWIGRPTFALYIDETLWNKDQGINPGNIVASLTGYNDTGTGIQPPSGTGLDSTNYGRPGGPGTPYFPGNGTTVTVNWTNANYTGAGLRINWATVVQFNGPRSGGFSDPRGELSLNSMFQGRRVSATVTASGGALSQTGFTTDQTTIQNCYVAPGSAQFASFWSTATANR